MTGYGYFSVSQITLINSGKMKLLKGEDVVTWSRSRRNNKKWGNVTLLCILTSERVLRTPFADISANP